MPGVHEQSPLRAEAAATEAAVGRGFEAGAAEAAATEADAQAAALRRDVEQARHDAEEATSEWLRLRGILATLEARFGF